MKKAVIRGEREARVIDVPEPEATADWVKLKVIAAPMCTEYKGFCAGQATDVLGHEAAGEVVGVDGDARYDVGDRVVAMPLYSTRESDLSRKGDFIYAEKLDVEAETGNVEGAATYAEYHLKPDWLVVEIPDQISYAHASMACCGLGPTLGAMERMGVEAFETVLVNGLGPVGLGGVINATYRGATVIGVEPTAFRAELAAALGADIVIDPAEIDVVDRVKELTDGVGVDAAIDCSGIPEAQRAMLESVRTRGDVGFIADGGTVTLDIPQDMIYRGLTLHGCWHYNESLLPEMWQMISDVGPKLDRFITHEFPLEDVQDAFELQDTQECGKVVLRPHD